MDTKRDKPTEVCRRSFPKNLALTPPIKLCALNSRNCQIWESEGSWRKRMVMQTCTGTRGNHSQPPPAGMDLSQFVDAGEDLASLAPPPVSSPIPPSSQNILVKRLLIIVLRLTRSLACYFGHWVSVACNSETRWACDVLFQPFLPRRLLSLCARQKITTCSLL